MVLAAKRLVELMRNQPGSMILGKQLASTGVGMYKMPTASGSNYRHNVRSMKRSWEQVGKETGSVWKVEAELYPGDHQLGENKDHAWSEPNMCMIWFSVVRG